MQSSTQLNPAQERAVLHTEGPLVVFAGAGSGKTRVITHRVAHLLSDVRVLPHRILAVTFTNKAANELRERLAQLAGEDLANDLWVGTFHAVCCRLLRRYHAEVGLGRNFVIYDEADQRSLLTRQIRARDLDERSYPPKQVLARIHRQKQEGIGPDQVEIDLGFDEVTRSLYVEYERALLAANAVDFDDLILHVMRLAESRSNPAGAELRARFDHVLVDEFQDTNAIQYRLIRALSATSRNLCVVGDDDQSIYSWRGADVRNIRGFRRDFAGAEIVKLEQNYRSSGNIVAAALGVIETARDREPKRLWTEAAGGDRVRVLAVNDEREEAQQVVRAVQAELERGTPSDQIAVFYRINAQSRVLEEAFRSASLAYQIVGGMRFFERAEIKDALAYARLLENPRSDADLLRIINVPARGIGDKTIQHLLDHAHQHRTSLWTALEAVLEQPGVAVAAKKKLHGFRQLIESLRVEAERAAPHEIVDRLLDETGYREILRRADNAESDARLENLEEFLGSVREYEGEAARLGQIPSLSGYLERVSLVSDIDGVEDEPTVLLMTVHAAKGLEFEVVFLTGMEEEMFPYRGMDGTSPDELEEERRLAYVAITRARKRLTITHAAARTIFGFTRYNRPSRFLLALPEDAIEQATVPRSSGGTSPYTANRSRGWFSERRPAPEARGAQSAHFERAPSDDALAYGEEYFTSPRLSGPRSSGVSGAANPLPAGRHVDTSVFDDIPQEINPESAEVRRGSFVYHDRFGRGRVQDVAAGDPPKVTARFPGWGERKVLLSKLRLR